MTKRPLRNVAASVHQRLLTQSRKVNRPFNELLQYFAMERLLYRLAQSPHAAKFVLKGALILRAWDESLSARPTRDIDLLGRTGRSIDNVTSIFREVCRQEVLQDGLIFDDTTVAGRLIKEDADYEGIRITFRGYLGNARLSMQIDIGFGDVIVPQARSIEYPTLLDFPAPKLAGYTPETVVAEKFEAMVSLDMLNTRMKDFYDVWLLGRRFDFDGNLLSEAIRRTFDRRQTTVANDPVALRTEFSADPSKQRLWAAFLHKSRLDDAPAELTVAVDAIAAFLKPIAEAVAAGGAVEQVWHAPGPWRHLT